jgi:cell division protein FtsZ
MTINLSLPQKESEIKPRITVVGVGGAGGNAVNNMISASLEGVEFIVANTDAQALGQSLADRRVQLGITVTQGLGAGARPEVGRQAAEEALPEILQLLDGANMVFVTAGMGGGTGTGAAPVIAAAAREQGILTIGVITKPFHFEGRRRMQSAEQGITELEKVVDTLIVIPNQNLFKIANEKTTFADAFKMADDVLHMGVRGVTDLMVMPGLINLDFADIRTVMGEMGKAMMGTGEAEGQDRSRVAAESAISNPLLEDHSMKGAKGVLINITGGLDMTLHEVDEAANRIREEVDADANIIFGSTFDATMQGRMRVSVVATGIAALASQQPAPNYLSLDMNRPAQTGQPALRPAAPAVGRVAMPAAAVAPAPAPAAPMAPPMPAVASIVPPAPPAAPIAPAAYAPAAVAMQPPAAPVEAPAPLPIAAVAIEPPIAPPAPPVAAAPPAVAPAPAPVAPPAPVAAPAAAAPAQRPMVDETDWRVSRPAMRPAVRATEPAARAVMARPVATEGRTPNLFQRITGAFATPKTATPAVGAPMAAEAPMTVQRTMPENVVAAPKPVVRPAPVQTSIDVTERTKSAREDDDLQIPAFLRRQAN